MSKSNLGLYQTMTMISKKVGGPLNFIGLVGVSGYLVLRFAEAKIRAMLSKSNTSGLKGRVFTVTSYRKDDRGLEFNVGDTYWVLEIDRDAVQIVKNGESENPYFVSADFLRCISDFPG